jgi:hypothetical protein
MGKRAAFIAYEEAAKGPRDIGVGWYYAKASQMMFCGDDTSTSSDVSGAYQLIHPVATIKNGSSCPLVFIFRT